MKAICSLGLAVLGLIPTIASAHTTVVYERDPYYGERSGVSVHYSSRHRYHGRETDRSIAARVQHVLRNRGYFHGEIDGAIGPRSSRAIAHYQHDAGLPVTGRIDRYLLHSLGI